MVVGKREVDDFRYREACRKNNSPAVITPIYRVRERKTTSYCPYDLCPMPQLVQSDKVIHILFAQTINLGNAKTKLVRLHL